MADFLNQISIGDYCTHCGYSTAPGSNRWVNRIPSQTEGRIVINDEAYPVEIDGWMCEECQGVECEECGQITTDYELVEETLPRGLVVTVVKCEECITA